jgi:hypothetical protein
MNRHALKNSNPARQRPAAHAMSILFVDRFAHLLEVSPMIELESSAAFVQELRDAL